MPKSNPHSSAISIALLGVGAAGLVYSLIRFWGANPEYLDRFLILAGVAYAAWVAGSTFRNLPLRPSRIGYLPLLVGAVAFPVGWFLQAQAGPKPVVLWWLTAAWVLTTVGFVLLTGGWLHLRPLAFPLAFVLFALPIPLRVLVPIQFFLQSATTTGASHVLTLLGVAVERHGFVLSLPGGDLGVAEACSGVRSVTALTAIAAFVAWWREFRFVRGVLLVLLSIPVIAGVNAVRVVASGLIQEHISADYVRGTWHEAFGVAMVLFGLGFIVALAYLMTPRLLAPPNVPSGVSEHTPLRLAANRVASFLLICSAIATVAAQFLGVGVEQEVVALAPIDQIPHQLGQWKGTDLAVPDEIVEILSPDMITRRVYSDLGYDVHVWVIFWSSRNMVRGYHHPDVCWPNRGFRQLQRDTTDVLVGSCKIPVTVREFARRSEAPLKSSRESDRQLILYWTQEGRRIWTEDDERQAQTLDSHIWIGDRLSRREQTTRTGRLVVLLGTPIWGDGTTIHRQTLELAGKVAEELYRVCPWAAPSEP